MCKIEFHLVLQSLELPCPLIRKLLHSSLIPNQVAAIVVFVIIMLHQLAQIPKRTVTLGTTIWKVWNSTAPRSASVFQQRSFSHVRSHRSLAVDKVMNLLSCVISRTTTSSAIPTFNMLDCIGSRLEPYFATNWTCDIFWSMHLHMHI